MSVENMGTTFSSRKWIVLLVLLLVPAAAKALSLGPEEDAGGWVALSLGPLTRDTFEVLVTHENLGAYAIGVEVLTRDSRALVMQTTGGATTSVGLFGAGQLDLRVYPSEPRTMRVPVSTDLDGEHIQILVWSAGEVGNWSWQIAHEPHLTLVELQRNASSYFWNGNHDGATHAHARMLGHGVAATDSTYVLSVAGSFRGLAGLAYPERTTGHDEYTVSVEREGSWSQECPCVSGAPEDWDAGTYTLRASGTSVHAPGRQPLLLAGVDAPLRMLPE